MTVCRAFFLSGGMAAWEASASEAAAAPGSSCGFRPAPALPRPPTFGATTKGAQSHSKWSLW
eukprot:2537705-Pyramimonas_sp.AAC.1